MRLAEAQEIASQLTSRLSPLLSTDNIRDAIQNIAVCTPFLAVGLSRIDKEYQIESRIGPSGLITGEFKDRWDRSIKNLAGNEFRSVVISQPIAENSTKKSSIIIAGMSVGHYSGPTGTIGLIVSTNRKGIVLISNNHVLAASNSGKIGDPVVCPGILDGPGCKRVGRLGYFVKLNANVDNNVDAAYAIVENGVQVDVSRLCDGTQISVEPNGLDLNLLGRVYKVGNCSGKTEGYITAFELNGVPVEYPGFTAKFKNLIEIASPKVRFTKEGDSGSLVIDGDGRTVGLHFAGAKEGGPWGNGTSYACEFSQVWKSLGLDKD